VKTTLFVPDRKEIKMLLAIHKVFEKSDDGRQVMLHTSDGKNSQKIAGDKIGPWIEGLGDYKVLRFTSVHAQDPVINCLSTRGYKIVYANWHKTGLEKNLLPEEIAAQFANLPDSVFREFMPRPDLSELRYRVSQRDSVIECRKALVLQLRGAARLYGQVNKDELSEEIKQLQSEAEREDILVPVKTNGKEKLVSIDTVIANLAKGIRECQLFNAIASIAGSWNTAAAVVAYSGGIDRFDDVASLWHYTGHAPGFDRKKKGQALSHNPKLKTKLWQMSDSIIKNRNNPWRDFYDAEVEKEIAAHGQKCDCKYPESHSKKRALRKMRKEILKRFFLAVKGEEYQEGRPSWL
jgi:hypothetical protein